MDLVVYGSHQLVEGPSQGGIPWLLATLLCVTFLCGCLCGRVIGRQASSGVGGEVKAAEPVPELDPVLEAWDRLVRRAVKFVSRRRRIGLAFASYRDYTLRNTPPSRPTQARVARRRVASRGPTSGIPPLQEGPAIIGHGSDRSRVGSH